MLETFEITGNLDFSLEIKDLARFRGNFLKQYYGMGAVFRVIPTKVPSIDDMKMPPILKKIALFKRGLVIVTGPTGSGKSTTMAAMINHINQNRNAHIITIEDPLEFTHHNNQCIIDHREIGANAVSFEDAIRSAIREDPDVILVGEMRDLETISLAIKAAEMGILVLGTLHTNSASKTIDRIIDVFPAKEQEQIRAMLSESIKAVIAQQLLKSKDGKGRIAALEVLISSPALSNIIREGKTTLIDGLIQTGKNDGMQTMDDTLAIYVKDGKVKLEDALERMHDTSVLKRYNVNVN
jgi:twitching motility protein PilT